MVFNPRKLSDAIRNKRFSHYYVASVADIKPNSLYKWVTGQTKPNRAALLSLAKTLGVDPITFYDMNRPERLDPKKSPCVTCGDYSETCETLQCENWYIWFCQCWDIVTQPLRKK